MSNYYCTGDMDHRSSLDALIFSETYYQTKVHQRVGYYLVLFVFIWLYIICYNFLRKVSVATVIIHVIQYGYYQ